MEDGVLSGTTDRFAGITINLDNAPASTVEEFSGLLQRSLDKWKDENIRTIWINISLSKSDWIGLLFNKFGFQVHHAIPPSRISLYKWTAETETCQIPNYAHHTVGVGGFVVNEKEEILVIEERFKFQNKPHWKLPGGYVDPGEFIAAAAVREVMEETGIQTEFKSLIAFRQSHQMSFGCSDLYFIACLKPLTSEIHMCQRELSKCVWMPLKEYACHELVHTTNQQFARKYMDSCARGVAFGLTENKLKIGNFSRDQHIFAIECEGEEKGNQK